MIIGNTAIIDKFEMLFLTIRYKNIFKNKKSLLENA